MPYKRHTMHQIKKRKKLVYFVVHQLSNKRMMNAVSQIEAEMQLVSFFFIKMLKYRKNITSVENDNYGPTNTRMSANSHCLSATLPMSLKLSIN